MKKTFQDHWTEVLSQLGLTSSSVDSTKLDSIKYRINAMQDWLVYRKSYDWRRRSFYFGTKAPYETGTVSVTKGGTTVTGSGTSWDDTAKLGYIVISNKVYKVDPNESVSSTSLELIAPFPDTTVSGGTYKLIWPEHLMDVDLASPIKVEINGTRRHLVTNERMPVDWRTPGEPRVFAPGPLSAFDYYSTGTVTVTNGSTTVTGSGTTWTSDMVGMPFKVDETPDMYYIQNVASATSITLRESYQGDSGAGKSYKIAPKYSFMMQMYPAPDDRYFVKVTGLLKPRRMVGANDLSVLPDDTPLLFGAIYFALLEQEDKNPVRIQQAKADFKDALQKFDAIYKPIVQQRWQTPEEIRSQQYGGASFNPLDPRS